jgi:methionyl-tRNA synthetase
MTTEQTQEAGAVASSRYYVTTAIDYPNARPHIGHALEKVAADVVARYHRLRGHDTYFSMGLDENSLHVLTAAHENRVEPQVWIDRMNTFFKLAWEKLDISYDYWMRTTEERHVRASQEMFRRALARGDIYKAVYSGWYCPNCNNYYTSEDLIGGRCPLHPTVEIEWLHEENYFFALSKYTECILGHIGQYPDFITPASRKAEVLALLKQGLRDFSISRLVRPGREGWGIPVPGDPQHVIYVWFDALINYLTAVGFPDDMERCAHYWPADAHVIGKDITRLHCLYWPAMLLSAGLPLPRQIPVHGFITIEGKRVSKTLGNIIDPVELVEKVGSDAVRYTLLRNLSFASDSDFSRVGLVRVYNDELGNDLGNLLNRVISMISRYRGSTVPAVSSPGPAEEDLRVVAEDARERSAIALERWEIGNGLHIVWQLVRRTNQYIEHNAPWKLAREPEQTARLDTVLATAAEATRLLSTLLSPYLPTACNRIREQLGLEPIAHGAWEREGQWGSVPLVRVVPGAVLFPRIDAAKAATL